MSTVIEKFDNLISHERYREALACISAVPEDEIEADWRLRYRRIWAGLSAGQLSIPEALMTYEDLAGAAESHREEAARPYSWLIRCYAAMRFEEDARQAAAAALEAHPTSGHVLSSIADMHLSFDDRPTARDWYERAIETDPDFEYGRFAYANLLFVIGQFPAALDILESEDGSAEAQARAAHLAAAIHDAMGNPAATISSLDRAIEIVPSSDLNDHRRLLRAGAHAALGDYDKTRQDLLTVWRTAQDEPIRTYARRRLDHLAAADDSSHRRQLAAFPTVSQKWDYCGPAVLELCLQYNGIELTQDEIADVVKRAHGTPMYEINSYLDLHDIEARRIEATPNAMQKAIDIGLPVIVQEEYSNSSHVAVIIGYDNRLGVLIAADPATHARTSKAFEFTSESGDLFGNGGILILGRRGSTEAAEYARSADEAGLSAAAHLMMVDAADQQQRDISGEQAETLATRVVELCNRALEAAPDFKLAHARRAGALFDLATRGRGDSSRALEAIRLVRTEFPNERFAHRLHAAWLMNHRRHQEALVEYEAIRRLDEHDALASAHIGLVRAARNQPVEAEAAGLEALRSSPALTFAMENLAGLYLEDCTRRQLAGSAELSVPHDAIKDLMSIDADVAGLEHYSAHQSMRRATLFSRLALTAQPDNPYNHETAGTIALLGGRAADALERFTAALELDPSRYRSRLGLAIALEARGDVAAAEQTWGKLLEYTWGHPGTYLSAAAALERMDRSEAAIAAIGRGVSLCAPDDVELLDTLFGLLAKHQGTAAAAARMIDAAGEVDLELMARVANVLDAKGRSATALELRRRAVAVAPDSASPKHDLASRLGRASRFREEAEEILAELLAGDHMNPDLRFELAKLYATHDPLRAAAVLDPIAGNAYAAVTIEILRNGESSEKVAERISAERGRWDTDGSAYRDLIAHLLWFLPSAAAVVADMVPGSVLDAHPDLEAQWIEALRINGRGKEALARIRDASAVTDDNAFSVFWAASSLDDDIAARAAQLMVTEAQPEERAEWMIRAAGCKARLGDASDYDRLDEICGKWATAWALAAADLVFEGRLEDAQRAIDKAIELDPETTIVLAEAEAVATARGDLEASWRFSRQLWKQHPLDHQGAERLTLLHALVGETDAALEFSLTAIEDGGYCHVAWAARAAALFVGGDHEAAVAAAERSLALGHIDERLPSVAELVLLASTKQGEELNRRTAILISKVAEGPYQEFISALQEAATQRTFRDRIRRDR